MSFIKKYKKDLLLTLVFGGLAFMAVAGDGFSDLAKTKFWWNFWSVAGVVGWVVCLGGWLYLWKKDRAQARERYENQKGNM